MFILYSILHNRLKFCQSLFIQNALFKKKMPISFSLKKFYNLIDSLIEFAHKIFDDKHLDLRKNLCRMQIIAICFLGGLNQCIFTSKGIVHFNALTKNCQMLSLKSINRELA